MSMKLSTTMSAVVSGPFSSHMLEKLKEQKGKVSRKTNHQYGDVTFD